MSTESSNNTDKEFSLLQPMGMGGIIGGDGYTFQERYIVCKVAHWIIDPQFFGFMYEGSGDVDVHFKDKEESRYEHIQLKDHNVAPAEFKEVLDGFVKIDNGMGKVYKDFILACPTVSPQVKSLADAIERYRNAEKFFADSDKETALKSTKEDLLRKIDELGLKVYQDFIIEKVGFEVGKLDYNDNGICRKLFSSTLVEHPKYKEHIVELLTPVYAMMVEQVLAHRGKSFELSKIDLLIGDAIKNPQRTKEKHILNFHNWSNEKYENEPTITLDWSSHFKREDRTVPATEAWNAELIPQLSVARKKLSGLSSCRHLLLQGKCALSSMIALGMAFPEIGAWTFEVVQPPQTGTWRSDADKVIDYRLSVKEMGSAKIVDRNSDEIAIVFSITGRAVPDVSEYFELASLKVKKIISVEPETTPGNFSIKNDSEAVSLAYAAKDVIKAMITKHKARKIHLFYFGPAALALFLGQKLTSVGSIQLYEFQDPGYKPSCLLKS